MEMHRIRGTKVALPYPPQLTPAEVRLVFRLQRYFEPDNIFPDLFLPRHSARSDTIPDELMLGGQMLRGSEITQIDCLAVNPQGIFVFESKDYVGYIYGRGSDHYWTQVTNYGNTKHRFYNPVQQNQTHIRALRQILHQDAPIYSVVVFGPDATLKQISDLPEHNFVINQANLPRSLCDLPSKLSAAKITEISALISANRLVPTPTMRRDHAADTAELSHE